MNITSQVSIKGWEKADYIRGTFQALYADHL